MSTPNTFEKFIEALTFSIEQSQAAVAAAFAQQAEAAEKGNSLAWGMRAYVGDVCYNEGILAILLPARNYVQREIAAAEHCQDILDEIMCPEANPSTETHELCNQLCESVYEQVEREFSRIMLDTNAHRGANGSTCQISNAVTDETNKGKWQALRVLAKYSNCPLYSVLPR